MHHTWLLYFVFHIYIYLCYIFIFCISYLYLFMLYFYILYFIFIFIYVIFLYFAFHIYIYLCYIFIFCISYLYLFMLYFVFFVSMLVNVCISQGKVWGLSHVTTNGRSVSQYVLASSSPWDLRPDINSVWISLCCLCWAPSLTRGRVCLLSVTVNNTCPLSIFFFCFCLFVCLIRWLP
jgi:hypothetical protein